MAVRVQMEAATHVHKDPDEWNWDNLYNPTAPGNRGEPQTLDRETRISAMVFEG